MAITNEAARPISPKGYEVRDYVSVDPARDYVLVRHYRTVEHGGGEIINEPVSSTEDLLQGMIRAFRGQVRQGVGTISGVFSNSEQARQCAEAVNSFHGKQVQLNGSELSVTL